MAVSGLEVRAGAVRTEPGDPGAAGLRQFQNLTALPSNIEAIEAGVRFADGSHPFVALDGPSGWGKSHLLSAVATQIRRTTDHTVLVTPALTWLQSPAGSTQVDCLLLDEVQEVLPHCRARHELRRRLEHRVRTARRTLLAWNQTEDSRRLRDLLPNWRLWSLFTIGEPNVQERELVVRQLADRIGVRLSRPVTRIVSRHLFGNARSIEGALRRLKLVKRDWGAPEDALPACGILGPYLLGHDGWDPRDQVYDAVQRVAERSGGTLCPKAAASFILLKVMGLSETDVATFLDVRPSEAYSLAKCLESRLAEPNLLSLVEDCRNAVLRGFDRD